MHNSIIHGKGNMSKAFVYKRAVCRRAYYLEYKWATGKEKQNDYNNTTTW